MRISESLGVVFLFLQFGVSASFLVHLTNDKQLKSDLTNFVLRLKRESTSSHSTVDANSRCVIKNLKEIEQKLEKALPPEKNVTKATALAKPHQVFTNADPSTLEKFCAIYKSSRFRLAACGESNLKTFAAKALAVVDFICIDRYEEFIKAFPCIQKVDDILDTECQKNCSAYESAAEKLNSAGASIVKKYNSKEIKNLFAQSCLYVECFMHCQVPMLSEKCGEKALDLEMNSIAVTFRNLDDMMSQSSASNVWPDECKPLSKMGVSQPVDSASTLTTVPVTLTVSTAEAKTEDTTTPAAISSDPTIIPIQDFNSTDAAVNATQTHAQSRKRALSRTVRKMIK